MTGTLGAGGSADAARLTAIAGAADAPTTALLDGLGLPTTARVVDVGCGTGSVAAWCAERFARVWALDRDTSAVVGNSAAVVVAADVREWAPPAAVDLVHARYVLAHLPDHDAVLARLAGWLGPGGALVVTEPVPLPGGPDDEAVGRALDAYHAWAAADGLDLGFARRVPGLMAALGLDVEVTARPGRLGGGPGVDRFGPLVERAGGDLTALRRFAADPDAYDVPQIQLTAVGRRRA